MSAPRDVKIVAGYSQYHCGECGSSMTFEPLGLNEKLDLRRKHMVARCSSWASRGCTMRGVRVRIPLVHLNCEVLDA